MTDKEGSLKEISDKLDAINETLKKAFVESEEHKKSEKTELKLELDDSKWLMERQVDSYLAWIGLWLVCLLGNVSILTQIAFNIDLNINQLVVPVILYSGLIVGMCYSVYRVAHTISDQMKLVDKMSQTSIKEYIKTTRGFLSRKAVLDNGELHRANLAFIILLHAILGIFFLVLPFIPSIL